MQQNNWHIIYKQQSPKLLGICRRYINDLATAEDIVQDSFMVAIEKENSLKNSELLNGWLCRIVINNALNYLKNEKKIAFTANENYEIIDESTMNITSELDKKSTVLAHDFSQDDLLKAIDSLSENHKSVFNLYIIDKFSHLEISKLLNISVGTSKSSLSRARKNVQEFLMNKLSSNKPTEKKNRKIAFLLFLGFGNRLFAQQFRKSFANFEVLPQTQLLNLSHTIKNPNINFAIFESSKSLVFPAIKATVAVLSLSAIGVYIINKDEKTVLDKKPNIQTEIVSNNLIVDSTKTATLKPEAIVEEKNLASENKIAVNNPKLKSKPVVVNLTKTIPKDTISQKTQPKVVVIKRQIIKRDTIYVQK